MREVPLYTQEERMQLEEALKLSRSDPNTAEPADDSGLAEALRLSEAVRPSPSISSS